jgi:hypothetical protein
MNRMLYAVALFAALDTAGLAHAQMNTAPPPAKPSAPEPIKQIPDPTLPNNNRTGCGWECRRAAARRRPPLHRATARRRPPPLRRRLRLQTLPRLVDKRGGPGLFTRNHAWA